ncbi:hypothetical protein [Anaeromyxobacter oryzisoli]|uniref:hypothetical protein n=1 Tax=Anaeromyxobacter oryzisoli TaxID=2925408 RepID=UPI001F58B7C3|nr:hypothetical protein [Anaeromyxobacter sp. SG63]
MAIVSGSVNYRFIDEKFGTTGGPNATPPLGATQWKPGTNYAAGVTVVNGGFLFTNNGAAGASAAAVALGPVPSALVDNTVTWTLSAPLSGACQTDAAQAQELGYIAEAIDIGPNAFGVGELMYVKFTGATAPGDFVVVDRYNMTAAQAAAGGRGLVGISMGTGAAGRYGWVLVRGVHDAANLGNGASVVGAIPYLSATGGRILTTASATNGVPGVIIKVTGNASNVGTAELLWPVAGGNP